MPLARLEDGDSRGAAEARKQESTVIRRFYEAGGCFLLFSLRASGGLGTLFAGSFFGWMSTLSIIIYYCSSNPLGFWGELDNRAGIRTHINFVLTNASGLWE